MAIVRWEPLREFSTLQNEMNRLFNTVFDTPTTNGGNTTLLAAVLAKVTGKRLDEYAKERLFDLLPSGEIIAWEILEHGRVRRESAI